MTVLDLDYETFSEVDLTDRGLDVYATHPSTRVLMAAYSFDDGPDKLWTEDDGPFPRELAEALEDPHVEKWAFNMQFEREITNRVLGIPMPVENSRCVMALAYMFSFFGGLDAVGEQMGMPIELQKIKDGKKLIDIFCRPQKITKNQPYLLRSSRTDPDLWYQFGQYCLGDNRTEKAIKNQLVKFPTGSLEWDIYELDQRINDRGFPMDMDFVRNGAAMARRRQAELRQEMSDLSGVANPGSTQQLLPWLGERGYPFQDLQKDTVKAVLNGIEEGQYQMAPIAVDILRLRQLQAQTSVRKFDAVIKSVGSDGRLRHSLQYAGASRTRRWAGRRWQSQNLKRTPKSLEVKNGDTYWITLATDCIREDRYEDLQIHFGEPMDMLSGLVRSAIRAAAGEELRISDLASIETVGLAWLSGNEPVLETFRRGLDPYKAFGVDWLRVSYDAITSAQRTICKPAVLGCGYGLGGGMLREGKKTGLWGYAENMGVMMTREEAVSAVGVWRATNSATCAFWKECEKAFRLAVAGAKVKVGFLTFEYRKPFLIVWLPGARPMYYFKPRVDYETVVNREGEEYQRPVLSYMGKQQNGNAWVRVKTYGGKMAENFTQAFCRDLLAKGMLRADREGFHLIGHAHDEAITLQRAGDNYFTHDRLSFILTEPQDEYPGLPLRAAGYSAQFYRKD